MKREGYPLPWCEELDEPYWAVNMAMCFADQSWKDWQAGKPMSEIIPAIDKNLESA